jgi:hypothetical protein
VFVPNIRIQNFGTVALTSAIVSYDIDAGASTDFSWNGNLAYGEFVDIDLPVITPGGGEHIFNISIASPNGNADERNCNDIASTTVTGTDSYSETTEVRLLIVPDNYGSETTWTWSDENGEIASGGPYTDNNSTPINEVFAVVPSMCYTFVMNDAFGDGICCDFGIGSYELRTDDDTIIFTGGEFEASESTEISTLSLSVNDFFSENNLFVYPNPVSNQLNIKIDSATDLPTSYEIVNMLGQSIVKRNIATNKDLAINTTALSDGMYFIRISKDNASTILPFIKE